MKSLKKVNLTQDELMFLRMFNGTKSAYRREVWSRDNEFNKDYNKPYSIQSYDTLQDALIDKGMLMRTKNGAVKATMNYDELRQFIEFQSDNEESLTKEIEETKQRIKDQTEVVNSVKHLTSWPESERRLNEEKSLEYHKTCLAKLLVRLNALKGTL